MNNKNWLVMGIVVIVALGIYGSQVGFSPEVTSNSCADWKVLSEAKEAKKCWEKYPDAVRRAAENLDTESGPDWCSRSDLDNNGVVNNIDVMLVATDIGCYVGGKGGQPYCIGDVDVNGVVNANDLLIVVNNLGCKV
jgi:hypothetical protein